jgi:hypothetical protein
MQQSPSWYAKNRSSAQEIVGVSQKPKVHYRIHNSLSLTPILGQIYTVRTHIYYSFKFHVNIVVLGTMHGVWIDNWIYCYNS